MALLQALNGPEVGRRYSLPGETAILGRDPECEVMVDVSAVSRRHARIFCESGAYFIEDLNSRNGTLVNGQAAAGVQQLNEKDRISICERLFSFHQHSSTTTLVDDRSDMLSTIHVTVDAKLPPTTLAHAVVGPESKLKAVLQIAQCVASAVGEDDALSRILDGLFAIFPQAERGFVVLAEGDEGMLVIMAEKHRRPSDDVADWISRTLVDRAMSTREAILSSDAANDPRFRDSAANRSSVLLRIRSVACVPLIDSRGKALGVVQLDTQDNRTPFDQKDLDLLVTVARLAAFAIENARLHEVELKKRSLDRDLAIAHEVQRRFLPQRPPEIKGYQFFQFYEAAEQLGGDYFDFIDLPDGRLAVVLADVAGKGVPAALLMARLAAETRYLLVTENDPATAFDRLSAGWSEGFVTMTVAVVDHQKHALRIVNAGNLSPLLRRADGGVEQIGEEHTGLPLGVSPDFNYELFTHTLAPGDTIVLLTDGLSEAMNADNELYGLDRLKKQLTRNAGNAAEIGERLLADVRAFLGDRPQADDMCLVCFGRQTALFI